MRRYLIAAIFLAVCAVPAMAQGGYGEVFGGYSFFRANVEGAILDGWNVSVTGRITGWLGIVGDFGGHYGSPNAFVFGPARNLDTRVHSFLFGPRLYANYGGISPYVHALFGAARSSTDTFADTISDAAFAMALG